MKLLERIETLLSPPSSISSEWLKTVSNALLVVARFKESQAVDILLQALPAWQANQSTVGIGIRRQIIETLGQLDDNRIVEPLIESLQDSSELIRSSTASALGEFGDSKAINPLINALQDSSEQVRGSAMVALSKLKAVQPLIQALQHENPIVREKAAWGLGLIEDDKTSVEHLIKTLSDENPIVRKTSAIALGWLKDNRAIAPLNKALRDNDISVRGKALYSLFNFKVTDSLIYALEDNSEYIREQAAQYLGELQNDKAIKPLSRLLEDSAFMVREAAKKSLAQLSQT